MMLPSQVAPTAILTLVVTTSCTYPAPRYTGPNRTFAAGFESRDEFAGFYVEPGPAFASSQQLIGVDGDIAPIEGASMHKSWIVSARDTDNDGTRGYLPHRAYPTVQFQKTPEGLFRTPCLVSLHALIDLELEAQARGQVDDWVSLVTVTPDGSDGWGRTVVANVGPDGVFRLVHVPRQGEQKYIFQNIDLPFPNRRWVRIDLLIDFNPANGYAKLWQDGVLVSHGEVEGGNSGLAQAHFGLYASARLSSGAVYNDKLRIIEVETAAEAEALVQSGE